MMWTSYLVFIALPLASMAAPLVRREADDVGMIKLLSVVEQFENAFYTQTLAKFHEKDFTDAGYSSTQLPRKIMEELKNDAVAHNSFLVDALGGDALKGCKFNFDPVLTDVKTAMQSARVFEEVAVATYTGVGLLNGDINFRVAISGIVTNHARQQSAINVLSGGSNIPQSFGMALRPEQALSVLSPFISGCNVDIEAVKPLKIQSELKAGVPVKFDKSQLPNDRSLFCHMMVGGQKALSQPIESCAVPVDTINGPVFIFITDDAHPLLANILNQNYGSIQAGPAIAFIDKQEAVLSKLVLHNGLHAPQDIKVIGTSTKPKGNKKE